MSPGVGRVYAAVLCKLHYGQKGGYNKAQKGQEEEKEVVSLKIVLQKGQTWTADQNPVVAFVELRKCVNHSFELIS